MKLGNLENVEAWKAGGMPPAGTYTARIDDASEGTSTNGYDQLELSWTVVGGEHDGAECRDWLTITEATRGKVVALLQATGIVVGAGDFELKVGDLIGRTAQIVLRKEPKYNDPDKMVTKVAGYKEAPSNGSNGDVPPDTNGLRQGALDDDGKPLPF